MKELKDWFIRGVGKMTGPRGSTEGGGGGRKIEEKKKTGLVKVKCVIKVEM